MSAVLEQVMSVASPAHFAVGASSRRWRPYKHLRYLNHKLVDVAMGRTKRLMVFMPPRHGKSELVSRYFPAWYLGMNPEKRIILASYEADFAASWGLKARRLVEEHGPDCFGISVSEQSHASDEWAINGHEGGMSTAGWKGPLTGKGADVAIIDDLIKNHAEAVSRTNREAQKEWYRTTFSTRLQPDGAVIYVATRWHEDDLAGWLLAQAKLGEGDKWEVVRFPALAEADDVLGRRLGEALCPQRYNAATLLKTKKRVGSFWWEAMYQQRPGPAEGGVFKRQWWRFYTQVPTYYDELIQSWDMTFKDTDGTDFVSGQVWGRVAANKYLVDQVRGRMDFVETAKAVKNLTEKWPAATLKLVEDKANGPAVISYLRSQVPGLVAVEPEGSKLARAHAVAPEVESGNVFLPDPSRAPWVTDFIEEATAFPNGANDDQVDAFTQAIRRFSLAGAQIYI